MPSLKDLKIRINTVKSTQKITSAMKMVASAKLKRAQEKAESGRPHSSPCKSQELCHLGEGFSIFCNFDFKKSGLQGLNFLSKQFLSGSWV